MIRPFLIDDYPAARALWEATPGIGLSAADKGDAIARLLDRNPGLSFVAREGSLLLGTILCGHDGRRGLVYHLATAPTARRRGIGRALLQASLDALRNAGIEKCHLLVYANNPEGLAFWRAVGASERHELTLFSMETAIGKSAHAAPQADPVDAQPSPAFECAGIRIRPPRREDRASLFAAVRESIATVGAWMPWCHEGYSLGDADRWLDGTIGQWRSGDDREFVITDAATGEVLGCSGINQVNRANRFANLGYWVRASRTGQGIATTAAGLIAEYGFAELGLSRLEIVARVENAASRRVAEKLGGRLEGIARNRLVFRGAPHDAALYALLPAGPQAA